jgi:hypothetical protein
MRIMETTWRLTLRYGMGYSGLRGMRCWVARLTGMSRQYGMARDFIEAAAVKREHYNRARTMMDFGFDLVPGLYEVSEYGDRRYIMVGIRRNGSLGHWHPDEARVVAILLLMDGGTGFEDARRATIPANVEDTQ